MFQGHLKDWFGCYELDDGSLVEESQALFSMQDITEVMLILQLENGALLRCSAHSWWRSVKQKPSSEAFRWSTSPVPRMQWDPLLIVLYGGRGSFFRFASSPRASICDWFPSRPPQMLKALFSCTSCMWVIVPLFGISELTGTPWYYFRLRCYANIHRQHVPATQSTPFPFLPELVFLKKIKSLLSACQWKDFCPLLPSGKRAPDQICI